MSKFKVSLNNIEQGQLDSTTVSSQRSIFVPGPSGTTRKLKDGETFTDSNYWKQFSYPTVPLSESFITVLEDDGSVYNSNTSSHNYRTYPKVYNIAASAGSGFTDNLADFVADTGAAAIFVQITNNGSDDIEVRLNKLTTSEFYISAGATQIFDASDLLITSVEIKNESEYDAFIQVIISAQTTAS